MNTPELVTKITEEPLPHGVGMNHLLNVLKDLMPMLDEIKTTVEHTSSNIPKASQQLSTVTQATENATLEILDVVDDMGQRIEKVEKRMKDIEDDLSNKEVSIKKIFQVISTFSDEQKQLFVPYVKDLQKLMEQSYHVETIGDLRSQLAEVRGISMNIAMSLQVQDITSQQIEGVRHLIESVRTQLANAVGRFDGKDLQHPIEEAPKAFDIEATYTKDGSRQDDADSIIAQFTN